MNRSIQSVTLLGSQPCFQKKSMQFLDTSLLVRAAAINFRDVIPHYSSVNVIGAAHLQHEL